MQLNHKQFVKTEANIITWTYSSKTISNGGVGIHMVCGQPKRGGGVN